MPMQKSPLLPLHMLLFVSSENLGPTMAAAPEVREYDYHREATQAGADGKKLVHFDHLSEMGTTLGSPPQQKGFTAVSTEIDRKAYSEPSTGDEERA
jgi:hypothetical protein